MIYLISFTLLTFVLTLVLIQQCIILPRLRREHAELFKRRALHASEALASCSTRNWADSTPRKRYPFEGWIELLPGGSISVAGKSFALAQEFDISAKDQRHIVRARAVSKGDGALTIVSHGQTFLVTHRSKKWVVQESDDTGPTD